MVVDTEGLERALDALLAAMVEADAERPAQPFTATPVQFFDMNAPIPTRSEMETTQLLREPVYSALRQAVRRLGQHAFAVTGGTDGMRDVADRVADLAPAQSGRRLAMMNSAWDGVGSESDRWWS